MCLLLLYKSFLAILEHPFFYPRGKCLKFLMQVSDRISDANDDIPLRDAIDKMSKAVFKPDSNGNSRIDVDSYRIMNQPPP